MKAGEFHESSRFHHGNLVDFMADLEKCKLENVKYQAPKFNDRDTRAILRF